MKIVKRDSVTILFNYEFCFDIKLKLDAFQIKIA